MNIGLSQQQPAELPPTVGDDKVVVDNSLSSPLPSILSGPYRKWGDAYTAPRYAYIDIVCIYTCMYVYSV